MWLRYGIALIGAIIGFVLGWRIIKRERKPSACDDVLLCWDEEPVSAWRQDWTIASFITLHSVSIIILAILFLLDPTWREGNQTLFLLDATPFMFAAERSKFHQTLYILATCGVGLVWYICGNLLAFPLVRRWIRPIHLGIMSNGVVSGPHLWEWSYFSHFYVFPRTHFIRFYSNRTPELACMAWQPPDVNVFNQAVALLGQYLPTRPSRPMVSWYRRRSVLIGVLLLAITIPFVGMGLLIYTFAFTWGWMYYTFIPPLMVMLGSVVFR
jgi:hypothetical protein